TTDGTSNTMFIGENSPNYCGALVWANGDAMLATTIIPLNWLTNYKDGQREPNGDLCDRTKTYTNSSFHCYRNQAFNLAFKSKHPGGCKSAVDGSVKFSSRRSTIGSTSPSGPAQGEVVSADQFLTLRSPGINVGALDSGGPDIPSPGFDRGGSDRCDDRQ
ncbi:MAG: hypothetical protein WKF75_04320, partial [Singulisphaera sp.]